MSQTKTRSSPIHTQSQLHFVFYTQFTIQAMAHAFVRNMTFQIKDLGNKSTLLLIFDGKMEGLYKKFTPWFGSPYRMQATYTHQLAFSKAQVVNGNIVDAATCVQIQPSEKTTLTEDNDVFQFSNPQKGVDGYLQAWNKTGLTQDMAIRHSQYTTRDGSNVTAEFTPILRAYITSDYQETAVLQGAIETPVIWEQNLGAPTENTTWNLKRDPSTGHYKITQA
ncbi:hypothetical protein DFH29DRAFT_1084146 [Suillus ampliporus]|nr:hypothetical protein DFH29DRAFT_1084146 [Suillus ampliporus]